jgi:hypothetical protein
MSSDKDYIVIAVLKNERTAHVYGPFSWDEAAIVQTTLLDDELLDLESCSLVSKARMKVDGE